MLPAAAGSHCFYSEVNFFMSAQSSRFFLEADLICKIKINAFESKAFFALALCAQVRLCNIPALDLLSTRISCKSAITTSTPQI